MWSHESIWVYIPTPHHMETKMDLEMDAKMKTD
jgi:hypothetical protein